MNRARRIDQTLATANRRRFRMALLVAPLAVTAYLLAAGDSGVPGLLRQREKIAQLKREIAALKEENTGLRQTTALLQGDLRTIERIARERYGMVMDGESVYMVYPKAEKGASP